MSHEDWIFEDPIESLDRSYQDGDSYDPWINQDYYDSKVEHWRKQPIEELIATVRPFIDDPKTHQAIKDTVEDYVFFNTIGEFQKLMLARFIARK